MFLFYYIYNIYRIEEQDICNIFTAIALCAFGIQIVQLLYPQSAVFGIYDEGIRQSRHVMVEIRNGIYRFRLETYFFTLFCLYYYWNRLLAKLTLRNIALFSVFLASTYLYLTRQIMIAVVITLMCSYLFIKNTKARVVSIMLIGILSLVLLQYSSELFKELFNRTKTELVSMNVRVISTGFYWEKICENHISIRKRTSYPVEQMGEEGAVSERHRTYRRNVLLWDIMDYTLSVYRLSYTREIRQETSPLHQAFCFRDFYELDHDIPLPKRRRIFCLDHYSLSCFPVLRAV